MPHYKLPSPVSKNATLKKRGSSWESPIYHCETTNTFWLLHMDNKGDRYLYAYLLGGRKPVIDKTQKYKVPDDWTGDPETVYVAYEIIKDSAAGSNDAVNLPAGFEQLIENGDRVLVTDYDDAVIGEVLKSGGNIVMVRRGGFGIIED